MAEDTSVLAYERGGPNDPTVTFSDLNDQLILCKEEFSPWGWRVHIAEFQEKMEAEKRLRSLNALPGSGAEPKDGVVKGTPVWQERLDKILLVEHLKGKLMTAHTRMTWGIELLLKSHAWLVKNPLLADTFSDCIRHIPPSQFDRVDILQRKLEKKRKDLKEAREVHEDYILTELRNRELFLRKTTEHLKKRNNRLLLDDVVLSWRAAVLRSRLKNSTEENECLQARVQNLQTSYTALEEDGQEKERQFKEALDWMTEDRDKYKKLHKRLVAAMEQAKRDLEASAGTAEGMKQMIMVLSSEKTQLEQKIEDLEEEKQKLLKEIDKLRALIAKLRAELRRQASFARSTELALLGERQERRRLEEAKYELELRMDEASSLEAGLRDDIDSLRTELAAALSKYQQALQGAEEDRDFRTRIEAERADSLAHARKLHTELAATYRKCTDQIAAIKEKARRDVEHFKKVELAKLTEDFRKKTDAILRRNAILEKEVAIADDVAPNLSTLNPLEVDPSQVCAVCQRIIAYEGAMQL